MKKIMLIIMSMLFSTMAYAQVQIINPGSQEGVFRQILSTIGDSTDHNFVQADNPVTAYTYIEGAEGGTAEGAEGDAKTAAEGDKKDSDKKDGDKKEPEKKEAPKEKK